MKIKKYMIYFSLENQIDVLIDKDLPSIEIDENISIDNADKILDNLFFNRCIKFHSEHSKIYQTGDLHIVDFSIVSKDSSLRKGEWKGLFDAAINQELTELEKRFIQDAAEKV